MAELEIGGEVAGKHCSRRSANAGAKSSVRRWHILPQIAARSTLPALPAWSHLSEIQGRTTAMRPTMSALTDAKCAVCARGISGPLRSPLAISGSRVKEAAQGNNSGGPGV